MITTLIWVSIISGGFLVFLLLLSIVGGLDIDLDIPAGDTDVDSDAGGLGLIKGLLTIVSTSSWVMKILLTSKQHVGVAIIIGLIVGFICFIFLNWMFKQLLRGEENVNWEMSDALFQSGEVYLKVPDNKNTGIVNISINGTIRDLKAISKSGEIPTGAKVQVIETFDDYVVVEKQIEKLLS